MRYRRLLKVAQAAKHGIVKRGGWWDDPQPRKKDERLFGSVYERPESWDQTLLQSLKSEGLVSPDWNGDGWQAYENLRDGMLENNEVDWHYGFPTVKSEDERYDDIVNPLMWYRSRNDTERLQSLWDNLSGRMLYDPEDTREDPETTWLDARASTGLINPMDTGSEYQSYRTQTLGAYHDRDRSNWQDPAMYYFINSPNNAGIYERIPDDEWFAENRPEGLKDYRVFGRSLFDNPETGEVHYDSPDGPVFIDTEGGYYNPNGEQIMRPLPRGDFWNPEGYRKGIEQYIADHPDTYGDDMFGHGWQELMSGTRQSLPSVDTAPAARPVDWVKQVNMNRPKLSPQQNAFYLASTAHRKQPTAKTYDDMQRTADTLDDKAMGQVGMRYYQDTLDQKYPNWQTDQGQAKAWMEGWSGERSRRRFNAKNWKKQTGEFAGNEWNIRPTKSYRAPTGWDVFMGRTQPIEINPYDK